MHDDTKDRKGAMRTPKGAWVGEPVKPRPVPEEYIRALRNAGARDSLIEALDTERRKASAG